MSLIHALSTLALIAAGQPADTPAPVNPAASISVALGAELLPGSSPWESRGLRVERSESSDLQTDRRRLLDVLSGCLGDAGCIRQRGVFLRALEYLPESRAGVGPGDRPGPTRWLSVGSVYRVGDRRMQHELEASVGVAGAAWLGAPWRHGPVASLARGGIHGRPSAALAYHGMWNLQSLEQRGTVSDNRWFTLGQTVRVEAGNLWTHGAVGVMARLGYNIQDPLPTSAHRSLYGTADSFQDGGFEAFIFAAAERQYMGRNRLMAAHLPDSSALDRQGSRLETRIGAHLGFPQFSATYTSVTRSNPRSSMGGAEEDHDTLTIAFRPRR
ncbi:MAG TPA: DUF2219 family protein [Xanthomonadaceae bacterium]|nr:DUF2219 family protein [Xanthomonadaceae bacterium]